MMTKEQLKSEAMYQATMHIAMKMVDEGIINDSDYRKVEDIFVEKYKPLIGKLFSSLDFQDLDKSK